MSGKNPKPKTGKTESTRTNTGRRGSRKTKVSELQKIMMGGGIYRNIHKPSKKVD